MIMNNCQNTIFHQLESSLFATLRITKGDRQRASNSIKSVILTTFHNHYKGLKKNNG